MRGDRGVLLASEHGKRVLCSAGNERIDADDCVLCRKLLVGHLNRAVLVKHGLEAVDGLAPSKVLNVAPGFSHIPRHHHAILEFLYIAIARHARLEKNANRRNGVDQRCRPFGQRIETANGNAAFIATRSKAHSCVLGGRVVFWCEPNRSANADRKRIPGLTRERKREVVQRDWMTVYLLAELPIPAERKVFDTISRTSGCEAKRVLAEVEQVLLAECIFVQLH